MTGKAGGIHRCSLLLHLLCPHACPLALAYAPAPTAAAAAAAAAVNTGVYVVLPTEAAIDIFVRWAHEAAVGIQRRWSDQQGLIMLQWAFKICYSTRSCLRMQSAVSHSAASHFAMTLMLHCPQAITIL